MATFLTLSPPPKSNHIGNARMRKIKMEDMKISFEYLQLLFKLEKGESIDHESSCFDYIEFIYKYDGEWVVGVFVESVARMEVKAKTLQKALTFWLELFQNQPVDWNYRKAGQHLLERIARPIFDVNNVNPKDIWNDS